MEKKFLFYFFFFLPLIYCIDIQKNQPLYKCNSDHLSILSKLKTNNFKPKKNIKLNKIQTNNDEIYKDIEAYFDLFNFEDELLKYSISHKRDIFINGLNNSMNALKSLLKIRLIGRDYYISDDFIMNTLELNNWDKEKVGDEAERKNITLESLGIDLYIFVQLLSNQELGYNTLAAATPIAFDSDTGQPSMGIIYLNRDINIDKSNSLYYFESIVVHELIHILGFAKIIFNNYFSNYFYNKTDSDELNRPYVRSPKVLETAKRYFNCNDIEGVPLEEFADTGTFGSHWEERFLLGELMGGAIYREEQVISEFTLSLLEDLGFYKANYYTGGLMQFGKNKGCEFLYSKCVNKDGTINSKFKNEFFEKSVTEQKFDPACSSGRQSRAYHYFSPYLTPIPEEYQYYNSSKIGGRKYTNYCPVSIEGIYESLYYYYAGHCSEIGNGDYGFHLSIINPNTNIKYNKSGDISQYTEEILSENSFCVLSSLINKEYESYLFLSNIARATCYKMFCSDRSLTIQINKDFIVCPREGGKVKAIGYDGYLLCPDYYLICSGTILCNNMFDCIKKKSSLKEIIYDYESKTTQDLKEAEKDKYSESSYELSSNGKCPQYCTQCKETNKSINKCLNCKVGYIVDEIENICIINQEEEKEEEETEEENNKEEIEEEETEEENDKEEIEEEEEYNNVKRDGKNNDNKKKYIYIIIFSLIALAIMIVVVIVLVINLKQSKNLKNEVDKISFEKDDNYSYKEGNNDDDSNKHENLLY